MPQGAALAIAAVAAGGSAQQSRQAGKQSKKANRQEQRLQDIKANRERRKQVRQARLLRAQAEVAGQAQGTAQGSQNIGQIGTQAASNIGFINTAQGLTQSISRRNQKAADFQSNAATLGTISDIATSFAGSGLFDDPSPQVNVVNQKPAPGPKP